MALVSVKLSEEFVESARKAAELENRSVPKQIEHWGKQSRQMTIARQLMKERKAVLDELAK